VFGYPDVVIQLARKTRLIGRRVVPVVAVSSSPSLWKVLGVTAVVEVDKPIVK